MASVLVRIDTFATEICDHPIIGCQRPGKRCATLITKKDLRYILRPPALNLIRDERPIAAYIAMCHELELDYLRHIIRGDGAKHWDDFIY